MPVLLHVGETMVYSVDPLVAIGTFFWLGVSATIIWKHKPSASAPSARRSRKTARPPLP